MKLLITGGAGCIGSNFVDDVYDQRPDRQLTIFYAFTYAGNEKNLEGLDANRYRFIKSDTCDESASSAAVAECDAVVHFAAEYYANKESIAPRPLPYALDLSKLHANGLESHDCHDDVTAYIKKESA